MMTFTFDLISDLHVDTWPVLDWSVLPTSTICIVAGDISADRTRVVETLKALGKVYQAVFYIDGNDEHQAHLNSLGYSYADLVNRINKIPNVVYLQDNVIVMDGVAILGTNGWWGFDFDLGVDPTGSAQWYQEKFSLSNEAVKSISRMSTNDAMYMVNSVKRLQTHQDVKKIVMITHTVPDPTLIAHDIDLEGKLKFNTMGNRYMRQALDVDTERKIHTWCFGHYHGSVDQYRDGVRYVNHCRGRGDTTWGTHVYYPKRITIDY
jgi:uncharacterized protein Veg